MHLKKRIDLPGFRPDRYHLREMPLFGILAHDLPASAPIDPYATDQAYWRTFQFSPPAQ